MTPKIQSWEINEEKLSILGFLPPFFFFLFTLGVAFQVLWSMDLT